MSEQLRAGKPAAAELARVLRAQIRRARGFLPAGRPATDEGVHDLRRAVKRARATLRLLRPALGRRAFHDVNRRLRDAARGLNGIRDARALIDALESLLARDPSLARDPAVPPLRQALQRQRDAALVAAGARSAVAADVRRRLLAVEARVRTWQLPSARPDTPARAMERLHRDARRAVARAHEHRTDPHLHEWRKCVKNEGHALAVLAGDADSRIAAVARDAERIGRHLGDDRDLALLDARLSAATDRSMRAVVLRRAIRARRRVLQRRAFNLGAVLYERKPRAFVRHLDL